MDHSNDINNNIASAYLKMLRGEIEEGVTIFTITHPSGKTDTYDKKEIEDLIKEIEDTSSRIMTNDDLPKWIAAYGIDTKIDPRNGKKYKKKSVLTREEVKSILNDILKGKYKNLGYKAPDGDHSPKSRYIHGYAGLTEDNTNNVSDDGDEMDKVQPKALKKKFKNRKDKDIDNDGDEDGSDEYLHNRRKTVSKAIDTDDKSDEPVVKTDRRKKLDKKDDDADVEAEGYSKKMKKEELQARPGTKAQQRAFDKADKTAKPKDKVSLKPMPASLSKKMKDESIGRTAGNSSYHNLQKAKRMAAKDGHDYDKLPAYDRTHDNHRDYYDNKAKTTKEDKVPSYLMKRIQEKANHVPQDETRDSFDKQVAGRRLTKTFNNELESQMTEQEFVDMHNPKNADVPEFTNAPVVHAKTFKSFKDSVKAGPKRSGDNDQGDKNVINPVNRNT